MQVWQGSMARMHHATPNHPHSSTLYLQAANVISLIAPSPPTIKISRIRTLFLVDGVTCLMDGEERLRGGGGWSMDGMDEPGLVIL